MGNAPVEPSPEDPYSIPQDYNTVLDRPVKMEERKKPTNLYVNTTDSGSTTSSNGSGNLHQASRKNSIQSSYQTQIPSQKAQSFKLDFVDDGASEDDDLNLVEVIQQLIPYYGQGNSSNDSNLRAALSGLTTEDIDSKDPYGNTLLILACCYRCEDLVRIMLNKGADPNAVNNSGSCCLHFACHKDSYSLVIAKSLLSHGASPDVHEMQYGCTPLHYCATAGNIDFCKLLISKGAQVTAVDYYGNTPIDYARESGSVEIVAYLNQKSRDISTPVAGQRNNRNNFSNNHHNNSNGNGGGGGALKEWNMYFDPASGCNYYVHSTTGEAVWENEFASRLESIRLQNSSSNNTRSPKSPEKIKQQSTETNALPLQANQSEKHDVIKKIFSYIFR